MLLFFRRNLLSRAKIMHRHTAESPYTQTLKESEINKKECEELDSKAIIENYFSKMVNSFNETQAIQSH